MTTTQTKTPDAFGITPNTRDLGCDTDDCTTCAGAGWILCDHAGTGREYDPMNADGHTEWCVLCETSVQMTTVWAWCPARTN
jgi:hypothetical protein